MKKLTKKQQVKLDYMLTLPLSEWPREYVEEMFKHHHKAAVEWERKCRYEWESASIKAQRDQKYNRRLRRYGSVFNK